MHYPNDCSCIAIQWKSNLEFFFYQEIVVTSGSKLTCTSHYLVSQRRNVELHEVIKNANEIGRVLVCCLKLKKEKVNFGWSRWNMINDDTAKKETNKYVVLYCCYLTKSIIRSGVDI